MENADTYKEAAITTGDPYVHEFGRYKFDKAIDLRNPLSSADTRMGWSTESFSERACKYSHKRRSRRN